MEQVNTGKNSIGLTPSTKGVLWAQAIAKDGVELFKCGTASLSNDTPLPQLPGPRKTITSISAANLTFRHTTLPFTKMERIRAVLNQEAIDTLLNRPDTPHIAARTKALEEGTDVFYAVAEKNRIIEAERDFTALGVQSSSMVVAELGAWPLLLHKGLISRKKKCIVVDGSSLPLSLYVLSEGKLEDLKISSAAANAAGSNALLDELTWLLEDLAKKHTDAGQIIALGKNGDQYLKIMPQGFIDNAELIHLTLSELPKGITDWQWLRAAGLALSTHNQTNTELLEFKWGELAYQESWRPWVSPWVPALFVAAVIFLVTLTGQSVRYFQLKQQVQEIKEEIALTFKKAAPNVPVVVDAKLQLEQMLRSANISEDSSSRELGEWMSILQIQAPTNIKVEWQQLHYKKSALELLGEVSSYEELKQLQAALQKTSEINKIEVEDAQIIAKKKKVQFKLKIY